MTPAQLSIYAGAYSEGAQDDIERKKQEIYLSASLVASFVSCALSGKQQKTYDEIFGKKDNEMTDEQMFNIVRALNAQFGGKDVTEWQS